MAAAVRVFAETGGQLAEGPIWSVREQALYWIEMQGRTAHRQRVEATVAETWPCQRMPACLAEREQGGMLLLSRNEMALAPSMDGPWQVFQPDGGPDFARERINDGAADRKGRFWFGTFAPKMEHGAGGLWRLDPDLSVHRMDTGITLANGIAWSPDDRFLYFADTLPGCIWRYDFSLGEGTVKNRTPFVTYQDRQGHPDGMTVDSACGLWVAEVMAGRVARYRPDATLDRVIALPVPRPTSVMFGGADLRTVFVTSMRTGMSADALAAFPLSGAVLALEAGVAGLPEAQFAG